MNFTEYPWVRVPVNIPEVENVEIENVEIENVEIENVEIENDGRFSWLARV
jgi:hypothetical protein